MAAGDDTPNSKDQPSYSCWRDLQFLRRPEWGRGGPRLRSSSLACPSVRAVHFVPLLITKLFALPVKAGVHYLRGHWRLTARATRPGCRRQRLGSRGRAAARHGPAAGKLSRRALGRHSRPTCPTCSPGGLHPGSSSSSSNSSSREGPARQGRAAAAAAAGPRQLLRPGRPTWFPMRSCCGRRGGATKRR